MSAGSSTLTRINETIQMGYLFGQYKRINNKSTNGGVPFMTKTGGDVSPMLEPSWIESHLCSIVQVPGRAVVLFAKAMLKDKNQSLMGKRCLIIGSGKIARAVADTLLDYGAVPLTFSDESGHVYEPNGIDKGKLKTISAIKQERGTMIGRYIMSSTTATFNEPGSIFDIPCDLCFPCGGIKSIGVDAVNTLADNGCTGIIEGGHKNVTNEARQMAKSRGVMYCPHIVSLTGTNISHANGHSLDKETLETEVNRIYADVKEAATEFNARGDLVAGGTIVGFLRVANAMLSHGAV